MPRHILIKLTKTKHKERILKAARDKQQAIYKGDPICLTADLSAGTLQARREWHDIFKVLKKNKNKHKVLKGTYLQPRLLYLAKISFKRWRNKQVFRQAKVKENSVPPYQLYNKC